jgi:methylenetetrahydrofolate--tRNA-(uracil-5-)-methyltransferase
VSSTSSVVGLSTSKTRPSALGALMQYLHTAEPGRFQPMNSNLGLLPPLAEHIRDKQQRRARVVERARADFLEWADTVITAAAPA